MAAASAPAYAFLKFLPAFHSILFPSHWLLSHIIVAETMDSDKRGMNTAAMTLINPRKEYWSSAGIEGFLFSSPVLYRVNYGARHLKHPGIRKHKCCSTMELVFQSVGNINSLVTSIFPFLP